MNKEEYIKKLENKVKKLEKENKEISSVINATAQVFFKIDIDGKDKKITYYSNKYKEIYGLTQEAFFAAQKSGEIKKYFHPDDLKAIEKQKNKLKKSNLLKKLVYRFYNKQKKKYVWVEEVFKPIIEKGKTVALYGSIKDITSLKTQEEKLKQQEEKNKAFIIASQKSYKDLFNNSPDLIYIQDLDLKFLDVNKAVINKYGYKKSEIIGKTPEIISASNLNDLDQFKKDIQQVYNGKTVKMLWWAVTKSGKIFPKDLVIRKGKYFEKEVIIAIGRDITKRIDFENKLKEKERELSKILNTIDEGIYSVSFKNNKERKFNYVSPKLKEILGYNFNEFVKISYEDKLKFYHPDDLPIIEYYTKLMLDKKIPIKVKYRFKPKGKKDYKWIEETVIPQFNDKGDIYQNFGVIRDITTQKVAEEFLKQNEEHYRLLFTRNLAGVFRTKLDGTIIECNNAFANVFGYKSRVELIGQNAYILYHQKQDRTKYISELKQKKFLKNYRLLHRKKDGSDVWILTNVSLIKDNDKEAYIEGTLIDITELVNIEKLLEQSRKNYKDLIENSPYGTIIHQNNIVLYANKRALEILKFDNVSSKEFTHKKFDIRNYLLPEYKERSKQRLQKALKGEELSFEEFKIKRNDGKIIEIESKIIPFVFQNKPALQVVFQDISHKKELERERIRLQIAEEANKLLQKEIIERKKVEKQLIEAQQYNKNIIESSLDVICASDIKGKIIEINKAALDTFKYTYKELVNKDVNILYANENQRKKVYDQLKKEGKFVGEIENIRKTGEIFTSFLTATYLYDEKGNIIGSMGISRDITQTKKIQENLALQSAKLNAIVQSKSHLIWTLNKDLILTLFNQNFFDYFKHNFNINIKKDKKLLTQFKNILNTENRKLILETFDSVFKGNEEYLELQLIDNNNKNRWLEIYLNPIIISGSKTINEVSCIAQDITDKKDAEQELVQSLKEKEILLKEVHHRVKNNLQVISSILNLQSSYVKNESVLEVLRESQNRVKSMAFIHESLYQTNDFSSVNFSKYISDLTKNLIHSYTFSNKKIDLQLDIEEVKLDLDRSIPCGLIVNELVTNALKYAFKNKKKGLLKVSLKQKENTVLLTVEDNGVGFPEHIDFRETESLGLQLVMSLVEQLNAEITLKNKKGATFTVEFKL
ncbi:MAG: PAS domain S-box protein [Vicingaceae bacterium]